MRAFSDGHRSDALYQGTTLVGPYGQEPMRALAPEVRSSRPNGELNPIFSRLIHQLRTNLILFDRTPLKAINKLHR